MAEDLGLELQGGKYALTDLTSSLEERMTGRTTVQFLSLLHRGRGSFFYSELNAARIKTNADVVSLFAIAFSKIFTNIRDLQLDIYPLRATLLSFTFIDALTIELTYSIFTSEGNMVDSLIVSADEVTT